MGSTVAVAKNLREHLSEVNHLVPLRVVTVVPGIEYYGKVLTVGFDHIVLETDYHTITVALAHIVSAHRDARGHLGPTHRNYVRATARALSTERPDSLDTAAAARDKVKGAPRVARGWRARLLTRRAQP